MEAVLELYPTSASHEVSYALKGLRNEKNCIHYEDGNPARAYIKQALESLKMEMEMEKCSDTTYTCYEVMKDLIKVSKLPQTLISYSFFTSAQ
ncbi:hypothetical protein Tco_0360789 [Tanacetum coccineum]